MCFYFSHQEKVAGRLTSDSFMCLIWGILNELDWKMRLRTLPLGVYNLLKPASHKSKKNKQHETRLTAVETAMLWEGLLELLTILTLVLFLLDVFLVKERRSWGAGTVIECLGMRLPVSRYRVILAVCRWAFHSSEMMWSLLVWFLLVTPHALGISLKDAWKYLFPWLYRN